MNFKLPTARHMEFMKISSEYVVPVEIHHVRSETNGDVVLDGACTEEVVNLLLEPAKERVRRSHVCVQKRPYFSEPQMLTGKQVRVAFSFTSSDICCHTLLMKTESGRWSTRTELFSEKIVAYVTNLPRSQVAGNNECMSNYFSATRNQQQIKVSNTDRRSAKPTASPKKTSLKLRLGRKPTTRVTSEPAVGTTNETSEDAQTAAPCRHHTATETRSAHKKSPTSHQPRPQSKLPGARKRTRRKDAVEEESPRTKLGSWVTTGKKLILEPVSSKPTLEETKKSVDEELSGERTGLSTVGPTKRSGLSLKSRRKQNRAVDVASGLSDAAAEQLASVPRVVVTDVRIHRLPCDCVELAIRRRRTLSEEQCPLKAVNRPKRRLSDCGTSSQIPQSETDRDQLDRSTSNLDSSLNCSGLSQGSAQLDTDDGSDEQVIVRETVIRASENTSTVAWSTPGLSDGKFRDYEATARRLLQEYDGMQSVDVEELFDACNLSEVLEANRHEVIEIADDDEWAQIPKQLASIRNISELTLDQLTYLVLTNKGFLRKIFLGKAESDRHSCYIRGGKERKALNWRVPSGLFTWRQHERILSVLMELFCTYHDKYFDYLVRVLLPEMLIKIVMLVYDVDHQEAEDRLFVEPPDNYEDD